MAFTATRSSGADVATRRDLIVRGCTLYDAPAGAAPVDVHVSGGRTVAITPHVDGRVAPATGGTTIGSTSRTTAGHVLDAGGRTVIPGLIDVHIHGAGGADVLDGTPDAIETMARALARLGTTSFLATTFLRPEIGSRHIAVAAECVGRSSGGANLLGLHLEGPFIALDRRGGIPADAILPPAHDALEQVLALADGTLRLMTIAPELDGCLGHIQALAARGVIPSFGHSAASYDAARAGFGAGIRHVTHLYNAMPGLHHRDPGPLPAIFEADTVPVELIGDGTHVHPAVLRWTYAHLGADRCIAITDGMRATGLPPGRYEYGGRAFDSRRGVARYLDGTLIGTAMSLLEITRQIDEHTGCGFERAIDAATRTPARALGIEDRKGSIEPGKDADLVLLEADGGVWATVVGGAIVYRK